MYERCLLSSLSAEGIQRLHQIHLCGTVLHFPELPLCLKTSRCYLRCSIQVYI